MTVRTAVLIQAHENPDLVHTLVDSLRHPSVDIYLHIDAKTSLTPFENIVPERESVTYLRGNRRIDVRWGGMSQIDATVSAIRAARETGRPYGRFALLSGSDIRIAPIDTVVDAWSSTTEFLRLDRCLTPRGARPPARLTRRHFPDRTGSLPRRFSGRIPRRMNTTIELYQGSQWWALTAPAVEHVLTFLDEHPSWSRFHRNTFGPDEIVIHSILANSPHRNRISQDFTACTDRERLAAPVHGMHYIDWSDPAVPSPRVLGLDDEPALRSSGALFARKVDADSGPLLTAALTRGNTA